MNNSIVLKLVKGTPTYKSWISQLTDEIFTASGFQEMLDNDYRLLEDFFGLSIRFVLNKILEANPRIPDFYSDIVQEYANEEGGVLQRINTTIPKPTNPAYRNLQDGAWVNDYKIRKPKATERFYRQNFDWATWITIQEINLKKIFLTENGISEFVAAQTRAIEKSYYISKFEMFRRMLYLAINSTQTPLKDTQVYKATGDNAAMANINSDTAVDAQKAWRQFKFILDEIHDFMISNTMSGNFNARSFEDGMRPEEHVLMIRHTVLNHIKKVTGELNNGTGIIGELGSIAGFKVKVVEDFGDEYKVLASDGTTELFPVYDEDGVKLGFNTTGGQGTIEDCLPESDIASKYRNEDIFAVLAQKGVIFSTQMNPFTIRAKESFRGMYINYIANQPNGAFNYDSCYNLIIFSTATE